jgi:hypothetical protein
MPDKRKKIFCKTRPVWGREKFLLLPRRTIMLSKEQEQFLKEMFFGSSWRAAMTRHPVWGNAYKDNSAKRVAFRLQVRQKAESFLVDYKDKTPPEDLHLKNIETLKALSKELGNELTVGTVQKLFNLLCKYYWCAGFIQEPPHLPVDRIMLQSIKSNQAWTKLDSMDEYKEIIAAFKKKSKEDGVESLAQWELSAWNAAEKKEKDIE